jgi:Flp pilus assembly protein TadG
LVKGLHKDRGAAAVEFALVMPVLLSLVVGIAEFGRAYNVQATLSGAAREGVRVMAVKNDAAAARAATKAAALPWSLTDSQISISPSTCPSSATSTTSATVTVTYALPFITGLFGRTVTLHGKGTMRCNG